MENPNVKRRSRLDREAVEEIGIFLRDAPHTMGLWGSSRHRALTLIHPSAWKRVSEVRAAPVLVA